MKPENLKYYCPHKGCGMFCGFIVGSQWPAPPDKCALASELGNLVAEAERSGVQIKHGVVKKCPAMKFLAQQEKLHRVNDLVDASSRATNLTPRMKAKRTETME